MTIPKTKTHVWDPAEHLITDEDMATYLEAALQEGDSALIAAALGDMARAKGMSQIARDAATAAALSSNQQTATPTLSAFWGARSGRSPAV